MDRNRVAPLFSKDAHEVPQAAAEKPKTSKQEGKQTIVPVEVTIIPGVLMSGEHAKIEAPRENQGHKVYALTLTGLAERSHLLSKDINLDTHITDIANLVEWEDLADICLVAHSYAGFPASGALERIGNRVEARGWSIVS